MKKFLLEYSLIFIFLFSSVTVIAQDHLSFIAVDDSTGWEQVLYEADKTSKPIFADVYTDWCGYCKKMDKEVFSDSEVSAFLNKNYINVKIDGETEFGKNFGYLHQVEGFPSYVFLDKRNNAFGFLEGYIKKNVFLSSSENFLEKYMLLADYDRKYVLNQLSNPELAEYYTVTGNLTHKEAVYNKLFSELTDDQLISDVYFPFFKLALGVVNDSSYMVFKRQKDQVLSKYGEEEVNGIIATIYQNSLSLAIENNDLKMVENIVSDLLALNMEGDQLEAVIFNTNKLFNAYTDNWKGYDDLILMKLGTFKSEDKGNFLYNEGLQVINEYKQSRNALELAESWMIQSITYEEGFNANILMAYIKVLLSDYEAAGEWLIKAEKLAGNQEDEDLLNNVRTMLASGVQGG